MAETIKIFLPDDSRELEALSSVVQMLSNAQRLKILCVLSQGEATVQKIVEQVDAKQSFVSQQLGMMRNRGLLVSRKEANHVYYRIRDTRLLRIIALVGEVFCSRARG